MPYFSAVEFVLQVNDVAPTDRIERPMLAFFDYNDGENQPISPREPVEVSLDEALRALRKLRRERSFLGVILPNDRVLQLYVTEPRVLWLEVLDRRVRQTEGSLVSLPTAEAALDACYEGKEIKATPAPYLLTWKVEDLFMSAHPRRVPRKWAAHVLSLAAPHRRSA